MEPYKNIHKEAFYVIGISVRTANKDGKGMQDIGKLFGRFFAEQIALTIPHKVSDDIYCVYTDYESNFMGEYTCILGCMVKNTDNIPERMIAKKIEASDYRLYKGMGEIHKAVGKTWETIWQQPDSFRKYTADFDVYGEEAQDPANAVVYTYLSVK